MGFDRTVRLPNLGLCSIAANLDPSLCEAKVLDLIAAGRNSTKYFQRVLKQYRPDVVGFSCMTLQYNGALELARITKAFDRETTVVMGGYHPTIDYEPMLNDDKTMRNIDFLIRNEGEVAFNELIKAKHNGNDFKNVPNLSFIDNGSIVNNPSEVLDLDKIKPPDRNARLIRKGFHLFGHKADVVETSRGCTFNCEFCNIQSMYGKSFRKYEFERILNDIRDAQRHGAKGIFIIDDNITIEGKRYKELCEAVIDAGLNKLVYLIQASVRGLSRTPGLIEVMVESGAKWVFLGIENISDDNLEFLDKNEQFKSSDVYNVVTELKRNGACVIGGFILGNPDDTEEILKANYEYAKKLGLNAALFFILTPFPKTAVRDRLLRMGLITNPDDYTQYNCFNACIKTKYLSAEQLFKLREQFGFRFPLDSRAFWRSVPSLPAPFVLKFIFGQLVKHPLDLLGYLKGLIGSVR